MIQVYTSKRFHLGITPFV